MEAMNYQDMDIYEANDATNDNAADGAGEDSNDSALVFDGSTHHHHHAHAHDNDDDDDDDDQEDQTNAASTHDPTSPPDNQTPKESATAAEERHIQTLRHQTTSSATDKLHTTLQRIKDVTKLMLNEMDYYLKEAESVEVDYVRCQYSQRVEGRRLEEVEPDIVGTTSSLKFGLKWVWVAWCGDDGHGIWLVMGFGTGWHESEF